jgi:hypothetical protein
MKKFVFMLTVLAIANVANAGFLLSVDGVVDPPESEVIVLYSETAIIDIHGEAGNTGSDAGYILVQGPGSLDASDPTYLWEQSAIVDITGATLASYISYFSYLGYQGVVDCSVGNCRFRRTV